MSNSQAALVKFIDDLGTKTSSEIADELGLNRMSIGHAAAVLEKLGFSIPERAKSASRSAVKEDPAWGEVAERLFKAGVVDSAKIAKHLSARRGEDVHSLSVTSYLKRKGLLRSIEDVLGGPETP